MNKSLVFIGNLSNESHSTIWSSYMKYAAGRISNDKIPMNIMDYVSGRLVPWIKELNPNHACNSDDSIDRIEVYATTCPDWKCRLSKVLEIIYTHADDDIVIVMDGVAPCYISRDIIEGLLAKNDIVCTTSGNVIIGTKHHIAQFMRDIVSSNKSTLPSSIKHMNYGYAISIEDIVSKEEKIKYVLGASRNVKTTSIFEEFSDDVVRRNMDKSTKFIRDWASKKMMCITAMWIAIFIGLLIVMAVIKYLSTPTGS